MAWEWGIATIEAGEQVRWWFSWGSYPGIQVFQARPVYSADDGVVRIAARTELAVSDVTFEWDPATDTYVYRLTVSHIDGLTPQAYRIVGTKVS